VISRQTFFTRVPRAGGAALLLMGAAAWLLGLLKHNAGFGDGRLLLAGVVGDFLPLVPPWDSEAEPMSPSTHWYG